MVAAGQTLSRWRHFAGLCLLLTGCQKTCTFLTGAEPVPEAKQAYVGNWMSPKGTHFDLSAHGSARWVWAGGARSSGNGSFREKGVIYIDPLNPLENAEKSRSIRIDKAPWTQKPVQCVTLEGQTLVKLESIDSALRGTWRAKGQVLTIFGAGNGIWKPKGGETVRGVVRVDNNALELRTCHKVLKIFPLEEEPENRDGTYVMVLGALMFSRDKVVRSSSGSVFDD